MTAEKKSSWKSVFLSSPGPASPKEALILFVKGICMGSADIIPGVSGGTIALITGIYQKLLAAIKSFDIIFFKKLFSFKLKEAFSGTHIKFLAFLLSGIALAILSLARVMHWLLNNLPVQTWAFFFGLILASIFVVSKKVEKWNLKTGLFFLFGILAGYLLVGLIPVTTPDALWFIFISGFIAICAMILPGISGAFILLILGKYEFITGVIKNPFSIENIIVIIVFVIGCVSGLLSFSRLLNFLLSRFHAVTLAFLTGLMAGSLRKIWPWKQTLESTVIRGKEYILREANILPDNFDKGVVLAISVAVVGLFIVLLLEKVSEKKES